MTQPGIVLGTAAYMSPEQAKGKAVDKRADIWAFGCILYECLTGKRTFEGETVTETLAAVLTKEPDWEKVPAKALPLMCRCFERDPKKRLRDIGEAMAWIENAPEAAPMKRPWLARSVAALAVLIAVARAFVHLRQKPSAPGAPIRFQIALPEKVSVSPSESFVLSPDGRHLAFTAIGSDGVTRLWIRALDTIEARPLAGTESNWIPLFFWSPESRFIAFGTEGKLKKIDISGGTPQAICDLSMSAFGGSWSRENVIIFGAGPGGIMRVPASGGVASPLARPRPARQEIAYFSPAFLPDGKHFLYSCSSTKPENAGVYIGSLNAKPEDQGTKQLIATSWAAAYVPASDSHPGQLLFLREGTLMSRPFDEQQLELTGEPLPLAGQVGSFAYFGSFSASTNGVLIYRGGSGDQFNQATWFDREGKALGVAGKSGIIYGLAISPDGMQAAIGLDSTPQASAMSIDIWLLALSHGTDTTRFTFGKNLNGTPVWTPDGTRIIFHSDRDGFNDLYQKLASGARREEPLLKSSEIKIPTSCSRDGRFLLYTVADPKTKGDLWILSLDGDRKARPVLRTEHDEIEGRFSPDMRWIAYVSDESGSNEIYVRGFSQDSGSASVEAGAGWMVSQGGGRGPRWRGDGKELYYIAPDGNVIAVEITAGTIFRAGTPKRLFQAPSNRSIYAYAPAFSTWDVAADGTRFLMPAPAAASSPSPFTVVLNWTALLKK
jgi:eukaryotic-like serine/threonine-protein kinase